jgi:putative hemolysin
MSLIPFHNITKRGQPFDPASPVIGAIGPLQTRLARSRAEVRAAQALRYEIFYNQMGGRPSPANRLLKRDKDFYDRYCDHLLVIDTEGGQNRIVGTYRMMRQNQAKQAGGFYSQTEYDLAPLLNQHENARFLELGRSCILPQYRTKRTMELLWHGTWAHAVAHKIDIMFGCASFEGTEPDDFRAAFSWLGENAVLDVEENCRASTIDHVSLTRFTEAGSPPPDLRMAMAKMPPLIKGYLRLGAKISSHAVIDRQFGTTDVLVVLKVDQINPRYLAHFGTDASRFAA